jgi:hypothetical protein
MPFEDPPYESDPLVAELRAREAAPEDVVLVGLLEKVADDPARYRLYGDMALSRFIELTADAIVHVTRLDAADTLWSRTAVLVRAAHMAEAVSYPQDIVDFMAGNPELKPSFPFTRMDLAEEYGMAKPITGSGCTKPPRCPANADWTGRSA